MRVSIVMATMNEENNIKQMIRQIKKYCPEKSEILIVDSSNDDTPNIAKNMGVKVILQKPQGHGYALKKALNMASGDIVITADCDLTYPIEKIPQIIKFISKDGYDIVSCCRITKDLKKTMPFTNKIANITFALIVKLLYGIKTHDVSTGMFGIKKDLAHTKWKGNFSLPAEIIIRSKLMNKKYIEIPIKYNLRGGKSTLSKIRSGKAYLRAFFYWKYGWFKNREM